MHGDEKAKVFVKTRVLRRWRLNSRMFSQTVAELEHREEGEKRNLCKPDMDRLAFWVLG